MCLLVVTEQIKFKMDHKTATLQKTYRFTIFELKIDHSYVSTTVK